MDDRWRQVIVIIGEGMQAMQFVLQVRAGIEPCDLTILHHSIRVVCK